jgi:hypothetical protein
VPAPDCRPSRLLFLLLPGRPLGLFSKIRAVQRVAARSCGPEFIETAARRGACLINRGPSPVSQWKPLCSRQGPFSQYIPASILLPRRGLDPVHDTGGSAVTL